MQTANRLVFYMNLFNQYSEMMTKEEIFDILWKKYTDQNPHVQEVYDLFVSKGENVLNDHIAFRTYDDPRVNVDVLSKAFVNAGYREMGLYTIEHTDGNIMPIIDQLVDTNPHGLHSLDPQAGVDMAEVKRLYGDRICLIGNVNCGMLDTGTDEQVVASARYALKHGMPGGGYIFSTSNCVYTGMRLSRYELMLKVWREEGNY